MSARLVLVTTNYPYTYRGGESMFVAPEVQRLARELGGIRVVPEHAQGARIDVPAGVEIDLGLSQALRRGHAVAFLWALAWPGFLGELWRGARRGRWVGAARVWRWAATAHVTYRWACRRFEAGMPILFYTYWRGGSTVALARWAREHGGVPVVTRVHRYELYEDCFDPPFQPWHPALYHQIALTAAISQHGFDYLRAAGVPGERLMLSRLGTERPAGRARASTDGGVRIVSCSFVIPVKRVPLMADALIAWARAHPSRAIHWTHFGDGPELNRVKARLRDAPANLFTRLPGHVDNRVVLAHYANEPVDAFLLLSESEGLPVSIQEAASAGIPVLATDVGGVRELVGDDNGALLMPDPAVTDVMVALERVLCGADPALRASMREASHRRWAEGFDAERNHTRFAQRLRHLMKTPTHPPGTAKPARPE